MSKILEFFQDESGATAVEYALIAGLMTLAIAGAIGGLGEAVSTMFDFIASNVMQYLDGVTG